MQGIGVGSAVQVHYEQTVRPPASHRQHSFFLDATMPISKIL
jgi:hypothetical protein